MIVQSLKVLTPIFSGIVGVFITSSLVSKNAEDKEKEKPLARLKDEDPIIEEYEDANEGKCDKTKSDCKGGSQGGQKSESEGDGQSGGSSESNQPSGAEKKRRNLILPQKIHKILTKIQNKEVKRIRIVIRHQEGRILIHRREMKTRVAKKVEKMDYLKVAKTQNMWMPMEVKMEL